MKIHDISQEVFGCDVYPGDPKPIKTKISSIPDGDLYNLSSFSMCAHNGTHVDAPAHFLKDGGTVSDIPLEHLVGYAYVTKFDGEISGNDAKAILEAARKESKEAAKRILIGGDATVSNEAAEFFEEYKRLRKKDPGFPVQQKILKTLKRIFLQISGGINGFL